jgi:DnaJ-class molecular chaperone
MANEANMKVKCGRCGGTGIDENKKDINGNVVPESCSACGGTGYFVSGEIVTTEIMDDLDKCKKRLKKIMDHLGITD